ncbi:MAG: PEGA domain-containing protein [bacterium]|nr:MAG: PEGA domain-containing protein [bacterium]
MNGLKKPWIHILIIYVVFRTISVFGQSVEKQFTEKKVVVTSSQNNIEVVLDDETVGVTPLRKTFFTESDTLLLQFKKEGYLTQTYLLDYSTRLEHEFKVDLMRGSKNKKVAVISSTLIPGSGQFYTGRYMSGFIIASLTFGSLYGSMNANKTYTDAKNDYLKAKDNYEKNLSVTSFAPLYEEMQKTYDIMEEKYKTRRIFYSVTAVFWLYNIVDSYLFFPKQKTIYLSLQAYPECIRITCNLNI